MFVMIVGSVIPQSNQMVHASDNIVNIIINQQKDKI